MSSDLETQLRDYGSWLAETYIEPEANSVDITAASSVLNDGDPGSGTDVARPRRWSLLAAAACLVVLGVAGLLAIGRDQGQEPAALPYAAATDPPEHLFLLPEPDSALTARDGDLSFGAEGDGEGVAGGPAAVLGREDIDRYTDLVLVQVRSSAPNMFGAGIEVQTASGPAMSPGSAFTYSLLAQQRGDWWVVLNGVAESGDLEALLGSVGVDTAGTLSIDAPDRSVLAEFDVPASVDDFSSYFEMTRPDSDHSYIVETATLPSVLSFAALAGADAESTAVGDTPAWLFTRGEPGTDDFDIAVAWRATPNRVVVVSSEPTAPVADLIEVAEQLTVVTAEQWFEVFPDARPDVGTEACADASSVCVVSIPMLDSEAPALLDDLVALDGFWKAKPESAACTSGGGSRGQQSFTHCSIELDDGRRLVVGRAVDPATTVQTTVDGKTIEFLLANQPGEATLVPPGPPTWVVLTADGTEIGRVSGPLND